MLPIKASEFHTTILDKLEDDLPWYPTKYMTIRWMRRYVRDPKTFGFFDDIGNFATISSMNRGSEVVQVLDMRATLTGWVASFKQKVPWFLDLLKRIEEFLINNLSIIIELILALLPKGAKSTVEIV
jgi:hypothetical protein